MIVRKDWKSYNRIGVQVHYYDGWFLFGFIPLYIRRYS